MNAKCRLLCLREMFIKYTDQNNYVSMERIQNYLTSCGYPAHKVTIKDDIDALISSGMEIEYIHNKGYHLRSRPFSLSILKILADAIASFRFLTVDDSEKLLKLIESLCSIYEAPLLKREIMLTNRVKSDNEQIFDNIDMINSAFRNNQQISFDYYDYDINKHLVQRGEKRLCSPFALVMSGECYYVVSYYEKYCNIVIDRFGKSVLMLRDKKSDNHFIIHVPVRAEYPQPFFSWIFSFRGKVEIISPIRLKERYTKVLYESCVQQYMN